MHSRVPPVSRPHVLRAHLTFVIQMVRKEVMNLEWVKKWILDGCEDESVGGMQKGPWTACISTGLVILYTAVTGF